MAEERKSYNRESPAAYEPVLSAPFSYFRGRFTPHATSPNMDAIIPLMEQQVAVEKAINDIRTGAAQAWTGAEKAWADMLGAAAESEQASATAALARSSTYQTIINPWAKQLADYRWRVVSPEVRAEQQRDWQSKLPALQDHFGANPNSPMSQTLSAMGTRPTAAQENSLRAEIRKAFNPITSAEIARIGALPPNQQAAYLWNATEGLSAAVQSAAAQNPLLAPDTPGGVILRQELATGVFAPMTAAVGKDAVSRTAALEEQATRETQHLMQFAEGDLRAGGATAREVLRYADFHRNIIAGGPAAMGAEMARVPVPESLQLTTQQIQHLIDLNMGGPDPLLAARARLVNSVPNFPIWMQAMGFSNMGNAANYAANHPQEIIDFVNWTKENPDLAVDREALRGRIIQEHNRQGKGYNVTVMGRILGGLVPSKMVKFLGRDNAAPAPTAEDRELIKSDAEYKGDKAYQSLPEKGDEPAKETPGGAAPGAPGAPAPGAPSTPGGTASQSKGAAPSTASAPEAPAAGPDWNTATAKRTASGKVVQVAPDGTIRVVYDSLGGNGRVVTPQDLDYEGLMRDIDGGAKGRLNAAGVSTAAPPPGFRMDNTRGPVARPGGAAADVVLGTVRRAADAADAVADPVVAAARRKIEGAATPVVDALGKGIGAGLGWAGSGGPAAPPPPADEPSGPPSDQMINGVRVDSTLRARLAAMARRGNTPPGSPT